jgi:hypothetical protein
MQRAWLVLWLVLAARPVGAQPQPESRDVDVKITAKRPLGNALALAVMAFGGVVLVAEGVHVNLEAEANATLATDDQPQSGRTWSSTFSAAYAAAYHESTEAAVAYAAGGVLVAAAVAGYFLTAPPTRHVVIHIGPRATTAGATWRF